LHSRSANSRNALTLGGWCELGVLVGGDAVEQVLEVGFGEFPLEWCGDLLVVLLEVEQSGFDLVEIAEVVKRDDLS